jgi:DNA-binding NtrC family response regulator
MIRPMLGTILLIEDDVALRTTIAEYLTRRKYAVTAAGTIAEATDALARITPNAVVADINLPDGDGAAFCLAQAARFPNARWILMSGDHERVQLGQRARDIASQSAFSVIDKPVPLRLLNRILAQAVG